MTAENSIKVWVVDVGPGSEEVARLAAVPQDALGGVLLTWDPSSIVSGLFDDPSTQQRDYPS